jgi:hypothetical protein
MPVTCKRTIKEEGPDGNDIESELVFKRFVFRRNWFMLSQTDGAEYQPPTIPAWGRARALHALRDSSMQPRGASSTSASFGLWTDSAGVELSKLWRCSSD